jgi:tetratricopeptide (TPR) repeat protein
MTGVRPSHFRILERPGRGDGSGVKRPVAIWALPAERLAERERRHPLRRIGSLGAALALTALLPCACNMVDVYEAQILKASMAIKAAKTDAERAAAYSDRGRGYSDKARLSLLRKAIDHDEYVRLFDLAVADHERAVALDPGNADVYLKRGLSFHDRAALVNEPGVDRKPWFDSARADFAKCIEKDPRNVMAYDFLGLVEEETDRYDEAIADFTRLEAIDSEAGKFRLAEAHCGRGEHYLKEKRYDLAAADLEKSIELGIRSDGCSCEPYNSLAHVYIDARPQYDKAWDLVHTAQASGRPVAPEYVDRLKKMSGRQR